MSVIRSRRSRRSGMTFVRSAAALMLLFQLAGCAGVLPVPGPLAPSVGDALEAIPDESSTTISFASASQHPEAEPREDGDLRRATRPPGGRYQVASLRGSSGWVILDTETGKFEHWVPVAGTSRYHVFGCKFEGGCSIFDKRSVDRGLDP